MGAVAFYESRQGRLVEDKRRTTIHGQRYDLVLYRSTTPQGSRGDYIRSMFPIVLANEGTTPPVRDKWTVTIESGGKNDGIVQITAALPNPEGEDTGNEWVELTNPGSDPVSLDGWVLYDRQQRSLALDGSIPGGESKKVMVPRGRADAFVLSNKGGFIALYNDGSSSKDGTEQLIVIDTDRGRLRGILGIARP